MKVLILGFVTNMAELMSACDVIITKAGPGTIMEVGGPRAGHQHSAELVQ